MMNGSGDEDVLDLTGEAPIIPLSVSELLVVAQAGVQRYVRGRKLGRRAAYGELNPEEAIGRDTVGMIGEYAFAKHLNVTWTPTGDLDREVGDIAGWHVRTTHRLDGHLLAHDRDDDAGRFVLVLYDMAQNRCVIAGWILGAAAKQTRWWGTIPMRQLCYCVPQTALQPIG